MAKVKKAAKVVKQEVETDDHDEVRIPESVYVKAEDGTLYGLSANLSAMCDEALEDISELGGIIARGSFIVDCGELPDNLFDRLGVVEKKLGEIITAIHEVSLVVGR